MKKEYDFSNGERGKFYFPNKDFNLPIYLNKKNKNFLYQKAEKIGVSPSELVNKRLEKEVQLIKELS